MPYSVQLINESLSFFVYSYFSCKANPRQPPDRKYCGLNNKEGTANTVLEKQYWINVKERNTEETWKIKNLTLYFSVWNKDEN